MIFVCFSLNRVSKVMQDCFGFTSIRSVVGLQNLRYPLNQSDTKLKPIMTWSPTFPRVFDRLTFFKHILSSHWLIMM